jgi:hypothetical protein
MGASLTDFRPLPWAAMTERPEDSDARSLSPVKLDPEFEDEAFLPGFRVVNHRLLGAFPYRTGGEAKVNATLDDRRAELRRLEDAGDFEGAVRLHHHDHRTEALLAYRDRLEPATYWRLAGEFYCDHSAPSAWFATDWEKILLDERPERERLMETDERAEFRNLSDVVEVMRGFAQEGGEHGFSWTRSEQIATHFAREAAKYPGGGTPYVAFGTVSREHVIAVLLRRGEDEMVVRPGTVSIDRITPVR